MIIKAFENALKTMEERNWDKIYILVDIHGVCMKSNYNGHSTEFFEEAIDSLRIMSENTAFSLIMWTCSPKDHVSKYLAMFKERGIRFNFINENPEVFESKGYGDYSKKLYANVLIDDKAGFDPTIDWITIERWLVENGFWGNARKVMKSLKKLGLNRDVKTSPPKMTFLREGFYKQPFQIYCSGEFCIDCYFDEVTQFCVPNSGSALENQVFTFTRDNQQLFESLLKTHVRR